MIFSDAIYAHLTKVASGALAFRPKRIVESAWIGHMPFAYTLVRHAKPRLIVELGTHTGNSYFCMCQAVVETQIGSTCFAVDTWEGEEHAGCYDESVFENVSAYNIENYSGFSRLLKKTFDEALSSFADNSISILHIDGLHTYEAAKHDFDSWYPKVAEGGLILLHDIRARHREDFGVWRLWDEIKTRYRYTLEFDHSWGLGVLIKGDTLPNDAFLNKLFDDELRCYWLDVFRASGQALLKAFELTHTQQELAQSRELVDAMSAETQELQQTNQHLQAELLALKSSTSWKISWPVRFVGALSKRILHKGCNVFSGLNKSVSHLLRAMDTHGGPVGAVRAAMKRISAQGPGVIIGWGRFLLGGAVVPHDNYNKWRQTYDVLNTDQRRLIRAKVTSRSQPPLISIVMPVFDPPVTFLRAAIDSVRAQVYPHWELCLADDGSRSPEVRRLLEEYSRDDARIRVVWRETNGGIAAASNTAISMARGTWVAFLDHDDELTEQALYFVASEIVRHPEARLIYSDEDKINERGLCSGPYFKPDWNLALMRSHNLITHLAVYRRDLLEEVAGCREGFEGAQDYDLALNCVERLTPAQIRHIPRVLYHWRIHAASTADTTSDAKPHAMLNGRKALQEHLERSGARGEVELIGHGFRVHYRLPEPAPRVSLIIPTRDRVDLLKRCVESLLRITEYPSFEVIIVDNGSTDRATLDFLEVAKSSSNIRVVRVEGPFNFARLNNEAARVARGQIIGLLNNDLEVLEPGWLKEMVSLACKPDVGAVGALLLYPNRLVQHAGVVLGIGGWAGHAHKGFPEVSLGYSGRLSLASEFSAVTGACLLLRKTLYEEVGGLDEKLAVACNDVDFCLRLRSAGYRNIFTPFAKLLHHESASRGYEDTPEKKARFEAELAIMREKWGDKLHHDPCYNPNLTLQHEDFSLAWPPRVSPLFPAAEKMSSLDVTQD